MAIPDILRSFFPFLRSGVRLQPELVRNLHPIRNPAATWEREGNEALIVIHAPRPKMEGWRKVLARFIGQPPGRRIELSDEIASDVWELCDGVRNVDEICGLIAAKYKMGRRQTEVSVLQFLNMLRSRRLVGVPEDEQAAIELASGHKKRGSRGAASTLQTGTTTDGNSHGKPRRARVKRGRRN